MLVSTSRWIALFLLILSTTSTSAQDNLLGLPKPRDASHPGAVLLHGGGGLTNEAFDRFVALAGGPKARIVLVPSAGYSRSDYSSDDEFAAALRRRFGSWTSLPARGQASKFQFLYTDDSSDADTAAFVRPLATATGVWFSGGVQSRLNYRFVGNYPRKTKVQSALREILERGGVVGGTSAGMAALPEIMTMTQDRRGPSGPLTAVAAHGLGLLTGAIVEQHFDGRSGRLERFTGLLRDSERLDSLAGRSGAGAKMLGLAVEESTGLVVQGDRLEVVGRADAHIFIKSLGGSALTWHTLNHGTKAELKRDSHGEALLARDPHR